MTDRYDIGVKEAIQLLGHQEHILMRTVDGTRNRKFTRRRALTAIRNSASRIYMQGSIDGDVVMFTTKAGVEWLFDAPMMGHQDESRLV